MRVRRSKLVRWTEQAEAERMCAQAMLQHEPQEVAVCPLAVASGGAIVDHRLGVLARLRGWFAGERLQMSRDAGR